MIVILTNTVIERTYWLLNLCGSVHLEMKLVLNELFRQLFLTFFLSRFSAPSCLCLHLL